MAMLRTLITFVQDCMSTNTFSKLVRSSIDIWKNHKRYRNICCVTVIVVTGVGTGVTFVMVPQTLAYFQPIVLQTLPFLGDVGSKISVGIIGFWIGGGFGFNIAKQSARVIFSNVFGHSNSAYIINNRFAKRIIDHNLQYFPIDPHAPPEPSVTKEMEAVLELEAVSVPIDMEYGKELGESKMTMSLTAHMEFVKRGLKYLRDQVDLYKGKNSTDHDAYKGALINLLEKSDVGPVIELVVANKGKIDARQRMIDLTKNYINASSHVRHLFLGHSSDDETHEMEHSHRSDDSSDQENVENKKRHSSSENSNSVNMNVNVNVTALDAGQRQKLLMDFERQKRKNRSKAENEALLLPPVMRRSFGSGSRIN